MKTSARIVDPASSVILDVYDDEERCIGDIETRPDDTRATLLARFALEQDREFDSGLTFCYHRSHRIVTEYDPPGRTA